MSKDTKELLKKVRKIEIKTRGLSNRLFSGEYHSAFKGRGMVFSEVREYMPGDDVRTIDWNVTARFNEPFIKTFEEERELTAMLLIDVSGSGSFGTRSKLKKELITEVSAVLSFSAIQNNDKIGVIFFSDRVEKFIPPKKGRKHILRIIREMLELDPEGKGTDIGQALRYFTQVIRKRSIAFLISDLMDHNFADPIKITNKKHDLVALRVHDPAEGSLPAMGWVAFTDPESGRSEWVNTSDAKVRSRYRAEALRKEDEIRQAVRKAGVDMTTLPTDGSYIQPLMDLFKRRER